MYFRRSRQEAVPLKRSSIAQVLRFQIPGLLEIVEGLLLILPRFGVLALIIKRLGRINRLADDGKPKTKKKQNKQSQMNRAPQASHQTILMDISFVPAASLLGLIPALPKANRPSGAVAVKGKKY